MSVITPNFTDSPGFNGLVAVNTKSCPSGFFAALHPGSDLKDLNELYESGVLTKEEFIKAKNKLLN